ncbi:MAG TPA: prepilin-type N-terminal cleavage/methylation domain-containing protein [Patescibacteria group bacterium]|nr:prepilin-type N-terminal cleavage/methylation domain-containing protein [Patescibacteria group bacterium]
MKTESKILSGFTLIELLVAMAIIALLATVVLSNFNQGNRSRATALAADVVSNSFRTAQNDALNPQSFPGFSCSSGKVPAEYHLYFDSNTPTYYTLNAVDKCGDAPVLLQRFTLANNVVIKKNNGLAVDSTGVGSDGGTIELKFLPPFSQVTASFNGGDYEEFNSAEVILESSDGSSSRTITFDGVSGRVDIK